MIKKNSLTFVRLIILICIVMMLSAILFVVCYHIDNKYKAKGPQAENGVLVLSEQDLLKTPSIYLTNGWEIYRGKLLSPEDFSTSFFLPNEYVFIGQYGGLEGKASLRRSPHGSATYRLNIALPAKAKNYTLELPEIYSAYKLYINGILVEQMGEINTENYYAETGNSKISIHCAERMEIIVAVSDHDHFYSGMVYPPAFGESYAVEKILNIKFGIRFAAVTLSLNVGVFYFGLWLLSRKNKSKMDILSIHYSILCLCFAVYICYPVVKTLTTTGTGWYKIENIALPAMLLFITKIQCRISALPNLFVKFISTIGVFICAWAMAVPYVMGDSINLMMAHSTILTVYTWFSALFLLATSIYSAYQNNIQSKIMLSGAVVFGTSLLMDRVFPLFEPIYLGWFSEISGGFFVLSIGAMMANEVAREFRLRLKLEDRVDTVTRMMKVQKTYYPEILKKEEKLRVIKHDFRHHVAVIHELASSENLPKLIAYLKSFDERINMNTQTSFCKHYVIDMLLRMYAGLAASQGTVFLVEATLPDTLPFEDVDLCVMISNLLENALEASLKIPIENRKINIRILCKMNYFGISVDNTFNGNIKKIDGHFLSQKKNERLGIGIASAYTVCRLYSGSAEFKALGNNVFHSEILLPLVARKVQEEKYENSNL